MSFLDPKYAHTVLDKPTSAWEPLSDHLAAVARQAEAFAAVFGWGTAARTAGLLHDIGKASDAFQAYLEAPRRPNGPKGPDHSTAGAKEACVAYPGPLGLMLAYAVAGHHGGLPDAETLHRRLGGVVPPYSGWKDHVSHLPSVEDLRPRGDFSRTVHRGFGETLLTRMLFSCLVDADFLATQAFYANAAAATLSEPAHLPLMVLCERLRAYMTALRAAAGGPVDAVRARVLDHAVAKAGLAPGLFTLTVPTGGGKTLASLSFALEHAVRNDLRRIIYVIPFTSIIEQTAAVFRQALSTQDDVLEHHASFDWEAQAILRPGQEEGADGAAKLRRAAENWDVPIVVTTAVQFFESLFAHHPARCRKLHNIAGSVIVLDEAQTLPLPLLRPCMAALDELARNYRTSIVLCTATQPALREKDGFTGGFRICEERELAPDPPALYRTLKRVRIEVLPDPTEDRVVAERFATQSQMLCIVNNRVHARALFEAIRRLPGATHLSTLMVPRHRRAVLEALRRKLAAGKPVRLVATSLIEAGVDIDLPEVWRAAAGLDSIAQAAGRCNRNGTLPIGRVVVFTPTQADPPHELKAFWQAAAPVLRSHREDVLGLDAIRAYFQELYWQKQQAGTDAMDALMLEGRRGVLPALAAGADRWSFPFRQLGEAFRLIETAMEPVIVPVDDGAREILREIAAVDRPLRGHLRRLQQYTVSIPRPAYERWLALGALQSVHRALPEGPFAFTDAAHYRPDTGLDIEALGLRGPESNLL